MSHASIPVCDYSVGYSKYPAIVLTLCTGELIFIPDIPQGIQVLTSRKRTGDIIVNVFFTGHQGAPSHKNMMDIYHVADHR